MRLFELQENAAEFSDSVDAAPFVATVKGAVTLGCVREKMKGRDPDESIRANHDGSHVVIYRGTKMFTK